VSVVNRLAECWKVVKTGDVCSSIVPGRNKPKVFDGDIPWITIADLEDNFWITKSKAGFAVTREEIKRAKGKTVPAQTVIMSCVGEFGISSVAQKELVINQQLHGFVCRENVLPEFLCWVLRSNKREMMKLSSQTTIPYLNSTNCESISFKLPAISEQKKIVEILGAWDDAIATTEKLITAKQKLKHGLLQRLIFGRQRIVDLHEFEYQNYKWFPVPSDWALVPISKIARSVSCKNVGKLDVPVLSCTKHFGLVDSLEYFGKQIFSKDTSTYKVVKRREFAYATNHIEEGSIGYQNLHDMALVSPMYTVFRIVDNQLSDDYLFKLLKTEVFRHIFQANTSASVDRRGSLRWNQFSQLKIPIPPLQEQTAICSILNDAQQEIDVLNKYKESIQKQKRGLMQKLLTGEWPVETKETA